MDWICAGAVQTGFKYLFISPILKRSYREAPSIGLTFGFAEATFIAVLSLFETSMLESSIIGERDKLKPLLEISSDSVVNIV